MATFDVHPEKVIDLLADRDTTFHVPIYQRGYAWDKTNLDELWVDVMQIEDDYLLGSMIFIEHKKDKEIIDGQQRLTTLYMICKALDGIIKRLDSKDIYIQRMANLLGLCLVTVTLQAEDQEFKLKLGKSDQDFFRRYVCEGEATTVPDKAFESQKRIKYAYDYLVSKLEELLDEHGEAGLKKFIEKLTKVETVTIAVGNTIDAYVIFETINDRGADLTTADLLKNYLVRTAQSRSGEDPQKVLSNWDKTIETLNGLNVTDLLVYFWRLKESGVTTSKLFKQIRKHLEEQNYSIEGFTAELLNAAEAYRKIEFPEEYKLDRETQKLLWGVRALKFKQWYPVLMAGFMKRVDAAAMTDLIRAIENLSLHLKLSDYNPSELETSYVDWAKRVYNAGSVEIVGVVNEINRSFPAPDSFRSNFVTKSLDASTAKLVLRRIESLLGGVHGELDYDSFELEHILPRTLTEEWGFDEDLQKEYLNDIGNLTLLAKVPNIQVSNNSIQVKLKDYEKSRVELTSQVKNFLSNGEWTTDSIEKRGANLLELAEKIWPYPGS